MTIRTLTLSPALDYSLTVKDKLTIGAINRTTKESFAPGGKGINVSIILKRLGYTSIALGFLSGFTGEYVEKLLAKEGLQTDFIHIAGITRINVKIDGKVETAINGSGPNATDDDLEKLFKKIEQSESGDILVMSGKIPPTLPSNTYEKILERISDRDVMTVVDSTGSLLTDSLKFHPFLIKPNKEEMCEILGVDDLFTDGEIITGARHLQDMGAKNVLVSLGKQGALLVDEAGNIYKRSAPIGHVKSTVGAGDSMVAGFLKGYLETHDYGVALAYGVAIGSATAFARNLASRDKMLAAIEKVKK